MLKKRLTTIVKTSCTGARDNMYKSLEDLMAGIYEMAAPDGIICNEVSKFLAANQVKPEDISSGIWFFLWLKSAPKDAKPIQKEIPGFGVVLNMPTYGGTLNEAITGLIENECRQIELAEGHPSLEAWVESVLAGRDDGEENEAAANIVDLLNIASGGLPGLHQPVVHVVDGVALAQAIGRDRGPVAGGVIAIAQNAIDPLSRGDAANRVITE